MIILKNMQTEMILLNLPNINLVKLQMIMQKLLLL